MCPKNKPFLDPFQFNFIMQVLQGPLPLLSLSTPLPNRGSVYSRAITSRPQVPGQTVAMHLDAPFVPQPFPSQPHSPSQFHFLRYFWGASRVSVPQWLLVTMVFSGLFQDKFVDQVQVGPPPAFSRHLFLYLVTSHPSHGSFSPQVVAYLHEWTDDRGGAFVYWKDNSGKMHSVPPSPLSGSSVDGSKTVHAGASNCVIFLRFSVCGCCDCVTLQPKRTWSLLTCL